MGTSTGARSVLVFACSALLFSCEEAGRCADEAIVDIDGAIEVSALTSGEAVALCQAIDLARLGTFTIEDYCLWKAVNARAMTMSTKEACEADYGSCIGQAVPVEQDDCSAAAAEAAAAGCAATVGDVLECINDALEERCETYSSLSCAGDVEASDKDEVIPPDSCKGVIDKCPMADIGTGFRRRKSDAY